MIVVHDIAVLMKFVNLSRYCFCCIPLCAVYGHSVRWITQNRAQMACLVKFMLFTVEEAVRVHLQPHQSQKVLVVECTVVDQDIVISESYHTVSVCFIMFFHLFGREIPIRVCGVAVQICLVRTICPRQQFNSCHFPLSFIDACSPATHFKNAVPQSPIKRTSKGGALF